MFKKIFSEIGGTVAKNVNNNNLIFLLTLSTDRRNRKCFSWLIEHNTLFLKIEQFQIIFICVTVL